MPNTLLAHRHLSLISVVNIDRGLGKNSYEILSHKDVPIDVTILKITLIVMSVFAHLHVCLHYVLIGLLMVMNYHMELGIILCN